MTDDTKPSPTTKQKAGAAAVAAAIICAVCAVEGGYVNNPKDPGGATNHGITQTVARQHGYAGDMKDFSEVQAKEVYRQDYIVKPGYEPFLTISPAVAQKLVDSGVNVGTGRSSRWLQTALNALNRNGQDYPDVRVDGNIGPSTVDAYQALIKRRGSVKACQLVIKLLDAQQGAHYLSLTNLESFMPGWTDNRLENVPLSRCG